VRLHRSDTGSRMEKEKNAYWIVMGKNQKERDH
jgi:hypothetical protein